MASCESVRGDLVAWVDRELGARRERRVRRHLESCRACDAEAKAMRAAVARQRGALRQLLDGGTDVAALRSSLQRRLAAEPPGRLSWLASRRPFRPAAAAATALAMAAAVVTVVWLAGGTDAVLIPLGLEQPPPALAGRPEMFKDYPLILHLEVLESLEDQPFPSDPDAKRRSMG